VGSGLNAASAKDLGLPVGTPVGVAMIDAHAGGLGVLGALVPPLPGHKAAATSVGPGEMEARMALIAGTSCCHMLSSTEPVFVPGVWGPYKVAGGMAASCVAVVARAVCFPFCYLSQASLHATVQPLTCFPVMTPLPPPL